METTVRAVQARSDEKSPWLLGPTLLFAGLAEFFLYGARQMWARELFFASLTLATLCGIHPAARYLRQRRIHWLETALFSALCFAGLLALWNYTIHPAPLVVGFAIWNLMWLALLVTGLLVPLVMYRRWVRPRWRKTRMYKRLSAYAIVAALPFFFILLVAAWLVAGIAMLPVRAVLVFVPKKPRPRTVIGG